MSELDSEMERRPSLRERFWRRLGFRYHWADLPEDPAFPGWMITQSAIHFSVFDRVRLLLTGRLHLDLRQATDTQVSSAISALSFRIGHPGDRT